MISVTSTSSGDSTENWLKKMHKNDLRTKLDKYGRQGVQALARATPVETGVTAHSWEYRIVANRGSATIEWYNTHVHNGVCVAIIIQYGHGTGTGGYVHGVDYVNPAMGPVFEAAIADFWKEVTA